MSRSELTSRRLRISPPHCTNGAGPFRPRDAPGRLRWPGRVRLRPWNGQGRDTIVGTRSEQRPRGYRLAEADVRLQRVTKRFGDVVAVDDLTLDVDKGEFFSLLGPSGCGKTTSLRMIGGFDEPTQGSIYLGGQDVTGLPPYRRDVNTVFQSYALFPHLNVFDNVAFGLRRQKVERGAIDQRVNDTLRLVDLPGFEKRKPSQLSGGQQQRVALARALVNQPQVLL